MLSRGHRFGLIKAYPRFDKRSQTICRAHNFHSTPTPHQKTMAPASTEPSAVLQPSSPILKDYNSSLSLPPKPCRPATLITQAEVDQYLIPHLYPSGWEVRLLRDGSGSRGEEGSGTTQPVTTLSKVYSFKTFKATVAYFNDAVEIIKKEKHHPRSTIGYNQIRVTTWTHHASRPSASGSGEHELCQGISAEDLILAMRFDALYRQEKHGGDQLAQTDSLGSRFTPSDVAEVHSGRDSS